MSEKILSALKVEKQEQCARTDSVPHGIGLRLGDGAPSSMGWIAGTDHPGRYSHAGTMVESRTRQCDDSIFNATDLAQFRQKTKELYIFNRFHGGLDKILPIFTYSMQIYSTYLQGSANLKSNKSKQYIIQICLINFFIYIYISLFIGGTTLNGYEHSGNYYLSWNEKYAEVGRYTFLYSKYHLRSLLLTQPLAAALSLAEAFNRRG